MTTRTSYFMRLLSLLAWAVLAASVMMVVLASPAWAATYTVTNTADSGAGSLRQAIIDANTTTGVADTINFELGSAATITLTSAQLPTITDEAGLTIDGQRVDITVSGRAVGVFRVASGAKLTLNNLTVTNGNVGGGLRRRHIQRGHSNGDQLHPLRQYRLRRRRMEHWHGHAQEHNRGQQPFGKQLLRTHHRRWLQPRLGQYLRLRHIQQLPLRC